MSIKLIYCTTGSEEEARSIARQVIAERLAACANIWPAVQSIYQWDGEMQQAEESVLLLKTHADRVEALIERVRALHGYDCPCIVALPVEQGHAPFLEWIRNETAASDS